MNLSGSRNGAAAATASPVDVASGSIPDLPAGPQRQTCKAPVVRRAQATSDVHPAVLYLRRGCPVNGG